MNKPGAFIVLFLMLVMPLLVSCQASPTLQMSQQAAPVILVTVPETRTIPVIKRGFHPSNYDMAQTTYQLLEQLSSEYRLTRIDGWYIEPLKAYCAVYSVKGHADINQLLSILNQDNRVDLAQLMNTFEVQAMPSPSSYNDPYFDVQYPHHTQEVLSLHQKSTGKGVRIAVIDTGMDRQHPDLSGQIVLAKSFLSDDNASSRQFDHDIHGTAIAGIIASRPNNAIGIVGLAPSASLLALKACWQTHSREITAICNSFTLAKALSFAIVQSVDIINLSLTGPRDPLVSLLIQKALDNGIIVVASKAGENDYLETIDGIIAVTNGTEYAPQLSVNSLQQDYLSTTAGGGYDYFRGASMATAQVTALVALLKTQSEADVSYGNILRKVQQTINNQLARIQ